MEVYLPHFGLLSAILFVHAGAWAQRRPDIVLADFEGKDYGSWIASGEAFGPGPAQGTLPNQMPVSGFQGHGLVNSYYHGDGTTGTLTSPAFRVDRKYINFLLGGGNHAGETGVSLRVAGKAVRTVTGTDSEHLEWATWDVRRLAGRMARIEIFDRATGGWGHINVDEITLSDERKAEEPKVEPLYAETYRPQFHFTAKTNWLNDPNGLVFYKGEYHLFFQHNPSGINWGNMTWGHAISRDLVHWQQLPDALQPDSLGTIFSGSAVVDWHNTTGFKSGGESPLVAMYTAAGDSSPESKGQPFTQCLAYSNDRGRTWLKYSQNPVLKHIVGGNRDPKLAWHAPTKRWIMALYLDKEDYALFASPDLKDWTQFQTLTMPGSTECPDFFEMPVAGRDGERKWVFTGANGRYLVGAFDGTRFTPDAPPAAVDYGGNYYAVQTYSDIPEADGRRIQIAWMNGGSYPHMPFNQQMSFPCELTLHSTPDGLRLYRWPVREIQRLYGESRTWHDLTLKPGDNPLAGLSGDLWDIEAEFEPGDAKALSLQVRGETVQYEVNEGKVTCLGHSGPLKPQENRVRLRLLVDRTSLELFGNGGALSMTSCFVPSPKERGLGIYAEGGNVKLISLTVTALHSAWKPASTPLR